MTLVGDLGVEEFFVHETFRDGVTVDEDAVGLLHAFR